MDGGGRVSRPLNGRRAGASAPPAPPVRRSLRRARPAYFAGTRLAACERFLTRHIVDLLERGAPRGLGVGAVLALLGATLVYGVALGGHAEAFVASIKDVRDMAANAAGFRIAAVAIDGHQELSRDEVLAAAGVNGRTSLAFLSAADARARLMANPWIADATVQKLYPDRLRITVRERTPYALWQDQGRMSVIAADGTVLQTFVPAGLGRLPLVVGRGAQARARDFLDLLARHPDIEARVRASVLVAERRWNLRLDNGIDVRLPESDPARALALLSALERDKAITARDIEAIDLRIADRITVRLSEGAAQARDKEFKDRLAKKKGGSA